MVQRRTLALAALAFFLALVALGAVPVGAALLADEPMPAWAGGVDEAVADEGNASDAGAPGADSASPAANAGTTQAAASSSGSSSAGSASAAGSSASQSASSGGRASSGATADDRGYVGPWYALNSDYVVQVEERFDAITEDEYTVSVARTALAVGAGIAALLAIVMFVRARKVQSKIRRRRR